MRSKIYYIFLFVFGLCALKTEAQQFVQKTTVIAGKASSGFPGGPSGTSGDGGPAVDATFSAPWSLALDADGAFYFSTADNCVRKVDALGIISTVAGKYQVLGSIPAEGSIATDVALHYLACAEVDAAGNVYLGYSNGPVYRVDKVTKKITTLTSALKARSLFYHDGYLYATDEYTSKVSKIRLSDKTVTLIAGTGVKGYSGDNGQATSAQLNDPYSVAVDASGNVYIGEYGSNSAGRVRRVDASGKITTILSTGTDAVSSLAIGAGNKLYVGTWNGSIHVVNLSNLASEKRFTGLASVSGLKLDANDVVHYVGYRSNQLYKVELVPLGPAAPTNFKAIAGDSKVDLSWNAVTGATGYTIYRGASAASTTDVLASAHTGTTYTDNTAVNGTTYYYSITTTDALNAVSSKATAVSAKPLIVPIITANTDLFANVGDAAITITAPASTSSGAFTYTSGNTAVASISGNQITIGAVGQATITATQAAAGAYGEGTTTFKVTVTALPAPTLGSFAGISKLLGDANFTLTAPTSNSSGAFTYSSSNTNIATISGNTVTIIGAGVATITATQASDGTYAAGTATATLTVGIKPPGNALTFKGSGDFVQIGTANTFDARTMKTIEAWIKFSDLNAVQEIISKSTGSNGLELIIYNGQLAVFAMGSQQDRHVDYPTSNLVADRWYHVAATHNGPNSTLTLYLNGVSVGTPVQTPSGMTNSSNSLHLGKWNENGNLGTAGRYFTGSLDEVRIWNVQRSQADIQAGIYGEIDPTTAGLQAYYRFSEGIANGNNTTVATTLDATSNANNGTLNGFTKTGSASNYTESYAMVVPVLQDAEDITGEGFTAKWLTPVTGTVDNYLLDVSESSSFVNFVTGYQNKNVGNVNEFAVTGLVANKTYYVRLRANKTSVNTQGTYSNVKTVSTAKSNQTITFNDLAAKTYGNATFNLSATSTSNLAVTFESSDATIASISGTTVTIKKAGTVNIIAKQAGNSLYNAATNVSKELVINKAALTVTAKAASKTYDKVAYAGGNGLNYTGFITGDNETNSLTGTVAYTGTSQGAIAANTYTIMPSGLSSINYVITYAEGTLTINKAALTVTAKAASKTYDKVAYSGGNDVSYLGFLTGDDATNNITGTVAYAGTSQGAIAANSYTIIPSGLSSTNYAITYANGTLTINRAALTVTAQSATKTYDKVAYAGGNNVTYSGFITGDNVTNSVTGTVVYGGTSQGAIAANTYTIVPSGLSSTNYTIGYANGTLTINKATLNVTAQNATKTYNGLAYTGGNGITYAGFITGDSETNSVTGTVVYVGTSQNAINVNNYVITPSGLNSANYDISYKNGTLTVSRAALTAIAENKARCFGLTNPAFTVRYTGFVNNETASVLTTAPAVSTTATTNSVAGNYTLTVAGGVAANYTIAYQPGQLTVYALPVIDITAGKTTISRGDQIQLVASGGNSYSWSNANGIIGGQSAATLTIRPSVTTTYQVTVTNANGCTDVKSITIEVAEDFKITGTNLLTPNGDGYNDYFVLENIDLYPNNEVKIFDKAGRLLYSKVRYDNTFDGTFNGTPLAEGTYYYIIDFGKGKVVKKGFISIVRNGK